MTFIFELLKLLIIRFHSRVEFHSFHYILLQVKTLRGWQAGRQHNLETKVEYKNMFNNFAGVTSQHPCRTLFRYSCLSMTPWYVPKKLLTSIEGPHLHKNKCLALRYCWFLQYRTKVISYNLQLPLSMRKDFQDSMISNPVLILHKRGEQGRLGPFQQIFMVQGSNYGAIIDKTIPQTCWMIGLFSYFLLLTVFLHSPSTVESEPQDEAFLRLCWAQARHMDYHMSNKLFHFFFFMCELVLLMNNLMVGLTPVSVKFGPQPIIQRGIINF